MVYLLFDLSGKSMASVPVCVHFCISRPGGIVAFPGSIIKLAGSHRDAQLLLMFPPAERIRNVPNCRDMLKSAPDGKPTASPEEMLEYISPYWVCTQGFTSDTNEHSVLPKLSTAQMLK